jgi:alpha-ketoglutarate-dependent taurine dioxygenase
MNYMLADTLDVNVQFFSREQELPLVITPKDKQMDVIVWSKNNKNWLINLLTQYGGILFRDFEVDSSEEFQEFIQAVSDEALEYKEQSSPRKAVNGYIYTSTDHPENQEIFLHSEQSYNLSFPFRIFFYCNKPSVTGGNTPIADNRKIFDRISAITKEKFLRKQYKFSRCFWPDMGVTWERAFQTENRMDVEQYCSENGISYEWMIGGGLRTSQVRSTVAQHPISGDKCWFNHCTFFHISTLSESIQKVLKASFSEEQLPNNTYYGDGEAIEDSVIEELRAAYEAEKVEFEWKKGDVLMLDNILTAHGRRSYVGDRSILTGMSELKKWAEIEYKDNTNQSLLI